jgi:hypothetical protein
MNQTPTREDAVQALDRLAELILSDPSFVDRLTDRSRDPREEYGLGNLPDEAMAALADISPDEMRLLAQIHRRRKPVVIGEEVCIFF